MPTTTILAGDVKDVHCNDSMDLQRSKLKQDSKKYNIPLEDLRIFDSASNAVLPNTAASDDLGLLLGTQGTDGFSVQTSDAKATTVTQKARFRFWLPPEYDAGETVQVCAYAGMKTTVSDTTATIDFSVYKKNEADNTHGSDLVTTGATTINSLTLAEKAFSLTTTGFVNGDELSGLITIAITDGATGTAVLGFVTKFYLLIDIKG